MMSSKMNSFEDKIKLPVTETISRFYQPQTNRKAIRILTVAVYVLCVSLAAIMLSLYYIFIWDPTIKTFIPGKSSTNCEKFIIPEHIAIRLINSTEISADQFYKNILEFYQRKHRFYKNPPSLIKSTNYNNNKNNIITKMRNATPKFRHPTTVTTSTIPTTKTTTTTTIPITENTYISTKTKKLENYISAKLYGKKINEDDEDYTDDMDIMESSGQYPIIRK